MPSNILSNIKLNERYDVEALIGNPPGWALRWGMTVLLMVVALLFFVAYLVKYPDVVEARTVLTTENPPIRLAANVSAKISQLNVSNGSEVSPGDVLAVLENPAQMRDVILLDSLIQKLNGRAAIDFPAIDFPSDLQLGRLQTGYADFLQGWKDLQYFLSKDINYLKINNLRKQIEEVQELNKSLQKQEEILKEEVGLALKNMKRDSTLLANNSGYLFEFEKSKSEWLSRSREMEALHSNTSNNNLRIQQMQSQVLDFQQLQSDGESKRILDFRTEVQRLKGQIDSWKQDFLLVAPVSGEVALTSAWSEKQQVEEGTEVMTIVPKTSAGKWLAKAILPSAGAGKVKVGMTVNIRLDGFPYQEFGVLNGTVQRIAIVPSDQGYEIEITIPDDSKTSFEKSVPFRQEMQGLARIVTEKRSLLSRVLGRILAVFESN
ncbi:MAG: HlyD family efflux transporter periplasmic adaptor subunit [Bacteroidetes bacterium]|nr:HlyD family efflux transporter periplasmic adaptor subunit [Bacteroidota bacterium]